MRFRASSVVLAAGTVLAGFLSLTAPSTATAATRSAAAKTTPAGATAATPLIPQHRRTTGTATALAHGRHGLQFPGAGPCEATFCWTPGEPVLAVGPTAVLETVNTEATVYDKATGTLVATLDFETFWDGSGTDQCVDPRALYLVGAGRFAISCTDTTGADPVRFAVSQTGDPTGAWYKYTVPNAGFLDQDKILATSDKFIVAGNTSTVEDIYVYNLADVIAGVASPEVAALTAKKSNLYQAAVEQTSASAGYMVASFPGSPLYLATITGTPAAHNVAVKERSIASSDFPAPQEPAVPGGHIGGGDLDGRVYDAVYEVETSDNHPVIQYSSARECGTRTCISSARIDLSGAAPKVTSYLLDGEPGWDYSYGAVGLDAAGNVYQAYTRTSPTSPPAAAVAGPGFDVTLQAPTRATTACASGQTAPCDERWGDYLGTTLDPTDPTKVWVSGLYQDTSGGYGWGTIIEELSLTSFALPSVSVTKATGVTASSATVKVTVNPNGAVTTIHVDYGLTAGYDTATEAITVGSGTAPVTKTVKLTGLSAGATYHLRAVATAATGNATTTDRTFATTAPSITSVVFSGSATAPTITINGAGFNTAPTGQPAGCSTTGDNFGTNRLWLEDTTAAWTAGQYGDCIGLLVQSWTDTSVTYTFGSGYATYGTLQNGDAYSLAVQGARLSGTVTGLN